MHRLSPVVAGVENHAISSLGDADLPCDIGRLEKKGADECTVPLTRHIDGGDVAARDQENVDRGLRRDVAEGENVVRLVDEVGRDVTGGELAEETVGLSHRAMGWR